MTKIIVRNAIKSDRFSVLKFCKNTFSWGDYIEDVWNYWLSEGNLLVIEKQYPLGMCHAFFSQNQVWIEGIRIDFDFRRKGLASELVKHVESLAKEKQISFSFMLIDSKNIPSLSMAKNLDYKICETWNYYLFLPQVKNNIKVKFGNFEHNSKFPYYVKSWRWLTLDKKTIQLLSSQYKIVYSDRSGEVSTAILTNSEHFENTLIVTLFVGSKNNTSDLISYIQNYAHEHHFKKIQILTKEKLSFLHDLEPRITFNLMHKILI